MMIKEGETLSIVKTCPVTGELREVTFREIEQPYRKEEDNDEN